MIKFLKYYDKYKEGNFNYEDIKVLLIKLKIINKNYILITRIIKSMIMKENNSNNNILFNYNG